MPIRSTQTPTTCRVRPLGGIELGVGWRLGRACDSKQRAEGVVRVEPPVEAEGELTQLGLEVLGTHAMVDGIEPGLRVAEDEVDDRHECLGHLGVTAFGKGVMIMAAGPQTAMAAPVAGDDQRPRPATPASNPGQQPRPATPA